MLAIVRILSFLALMYSSAIASGEVVFHVPDAGIALVNPTESNSTALVVFSGIQGDAAAARRCRGIQWQEVGISQEGWLHLNIAVHPKDREFVDSWLRKRSPSQEGLSNRQLLARIWRAQGVAFDALATKGRPGNVTFVLRVVPSGCGYIDEQLHSAEQARARITFPVPFQIDDIANNKLATRIFLKLIEISSHETAHLLQLYPFDSARLAWLTASKEKIHLSTHFPISVDAEIGAMMVDRCLRQAIMPNDWNAEYLVRAWRDDRRAFEAATDAETYRPLYERFFTAQAAILGMDLVGADSHAQLERLFPHCAMYLQRDQDYDAPSDEDKVRGVKALAAVRAVTPQIRLRGLPYDSEIRQRTGSKVP